MKTLFTYRSYLLTGVVLLLLGLGNKVVGTTKTASVTGNWNATGTWGGAAVPVAGDNIIINTGITVTVNVAATALVTTVVINSSSTANGITISGSNILNCGAITLNSPTAAFNSTIAVGAGTLNATSIAIPGSGTTGRNCIVSVSTGTINVTGDISFSGTAAQAQLTFTGAGVLNIGGNFGGGGTFTCSTGNVNFNGSSAQTFPGYTFNILKSNNTLGVTPTTAPTITTLTIADIAPGSVFNDGAFAISTATTLNLNSGTYNCNAANFPWGTLNAGTGTVNYSLEGDQSIKVLSYHNLTLGASGTKTFPFSSNTLIVDNNFTIGGSVMATCTGTFGATALMTISGNFSLSGTSSLIIPNNSAGTFTVSGTTTVGNGTQFQPSTGSGYSFNVVTIDGTIFKAHGVGQITIGGLLTIHSGGTWDMTQDAINPTPVSIRGGITNSGTFNSGDGVYTFNINDNQELNGFISIPNVTINRKVQNNGTLTVSTSLSGGSTLTQGESSVLNIGGTSSITSIDATTNAGNTVNYTGTSQTLKSINYYNLTLSGSGTAVLQTGTSSINGNFTISGSVATSAAKALSVGGNISIGSGTSFTAGTFTHNLAGNWLNNGTFTCNSGTINLNGTTQSITGATTFNDLTLSNSGAKTISPATINGTLSLEGESTTAGTTPGFGTAAAIRYKGSVAQTTGIELPATFSGTGGVTIDNSNGVTLEGGVLKTIATGSNLTITTGAFTIPPTGQLTVQGTITNSVGNTGLVLQSSASGTASLIQSNASVPATIERYIPGAAEAWHFLSATVAAQAISGSWVPSGTYGNGTGYDLYVWNEPTKCWIYKLNTTATVNWNIVHPQTNFVAGRGYLYAVQASNPTKSFAGNLNTGAINYSLTLTNDTNRLKGFNFVGNPYSSSVDWAAASGWTRTALETSGTGKDMWIWNESAGNYGIYNSADGDGVGTNGVTRYIAPMQGFFVKAATAGNLGFSDAIRVHDGAIAWKSAQINPNVISAIVTSEADQSCDEVRMLFGYPPNLTGTAKLFSHLATAPSLYLPAGDANFTVRYLTDTVAYPAVPVQFKPGRNGDYTLSFNFDESTFKTVLLEDRPLKVLHDLRSDPTYRFRAAKKDQVNRFILHLAPVKALTREELPARIFTDGEKILIDLTAVTGETTVCVYDLVGRKRYDRRLTGETQHTLNFNPGTQPLIIQLKNPQGTLCRKILCNNTSQ